MAKSFARSLQSVQSRGSFWSVIFRFSFWVPHHARVLNRIFFVWATSQQQTQQRSKEQLITKLLTHCKNLGVTMKSIYYLLAASCVLSSVESFGVAVPLSRQLHASTIESATSTTQLWSSEAEGEDEPISKEEKEEIVGNLVADDEWEGLGIELTELVRVSVVQDLKRNARDFLGKDDYKVGTYTTNELDCGRMECYGW